MDSNTFDIVYNKWIKKDKKNKSFWKEISKELNISDHEYLRGEFKNERYRRGLIQKTNLNISNKLKVNILDIEFSPMEVYTFGLWDQDISPDKVIKTGYVLCWSLKELNSSEIISECLTPNESKNGNDKRIINEIHKLLNESQIIIGHNVKEYDLKVLNTRFLYHGLQPLHPYQVIDTLTVARNNFAFPSNSLKYVNKFLGIKQKEETDGFTLWKNCMLGDETSLEKLSHYCNNDVLATEELYYKLRPYVKSHPNLALYFETDELVCKHCGSNHIDIDGYYYTNVAKYESIHCKNCGAWGRLNKNLIKKEQKQILMR